MIDSLKATQKRYGFRALALAIGLALILLAAGYKPIAKGLLLGTLFSVVNFVLMGQLLPLRFGQSRRKAFTFSLLSIAVRYFFMAVPVVMAIRMTHFHLAATIVGLFAVQVVILFEPLWAKINVNGGAKAANG